ncbi:MAG: DHA2 family efflux MFS transporter permease subunit [Gammaproteobacteria bacterium]|nr:DHA2 family efflux MFS transporter permease subunit [Gammaproteobacteria bacterium]
MSQSVPSPQVVPAPSPYLVLLTVSVCTMLYAMTATVVNVALPQLRGSLSASPDQIAWVVTLNVVGTAIVTPMTGWLTAKLGQRNLLLASVAGFAVASFLCATAQSLAPMLLYRVLQGMFGAPIVPVAQAVVLATFSDHRRAMAQGFFGMAVVAGMGLAPVLGGYIAEQYNWRLIFLLLVPCCGVGLALVMMFIRQGGRRDDLRLDWTGFLSLSVAIACMQLVLDRGERFGWLESTEILVYCTTLVLAAYVFIVHTATADQPFLNRELLRNRNYAVGLMLVCAYGMLNFTPITLLPPLLQNLKGYPDSLIGMLLATRGCGMIGGFFVAGRMGKVDPRISMIIGFALIASSGFLLAFIDLNVSPAWVAWAGLLQGIGSGVLWVPVTTATFWSLPPRLLPDGAAIYHLLRNLGQSAYIAISFLVVLRTSQMNYADMVEVVSPFNELWGYDGLTGAWSTDSVRGLKALSGEIGRQSQMIAFNNAFLMYGLTCVAAMPLVLLWRKTRGADE